MERLWLWSLAIGVLVCVVAWIASLPVQAIERGENEVALQRLVETSLARERTTQSMSYEAVKSIVIPGPGRDGVRPLTQLRVTASTTGGIGFVRVISHDAVSLSGAGERPRVTWADPLHRERDDNDDDDAQARAGTPATDPGVLSSALQRKRVVMAEIEFRPPPGELAPSGSEVHKATVLEPLTNSVPTAVLADVEIRISNPRYEMTLYELALVPADSST
jgi:hypothetical protein